MHGAKSNDTMITVINMMIQVDMENLFFIVLNLN